VSNTQTCQLKNIPLSSVLVHVVKYEVNRWCLKYHNYKSLYFKI
jgi:hypothetical protein